MKTTVTRIRKRDGTIVPFSQEKITQAIWKAARSVGGKDRKLAQQLSEEIVKRLDKKYDGRGIPGVEDIQDLVEQVLIEKGHARTAKAFIVYRQQRAELRKEKQLILEKEEIDEVDKRFDLNALRVLKARYLRKNEKGHLIETPKQLFMRVATHAALPDLFYDDRVFEKAGKARVWKEESFDKATCGKWENKLCIGKYPLNKYHLEAIKRIYDRANKHGRVKVSWGKLFSMLKDNKFSNHEKIIDAFYAMMVEKRFLPNTPALANFGNPLGMGSACFVMDVPDSLDGIMETLQQTAIIFQAGGGMGYNFSKLRPEGDFVSTTGGKASGPLSFMRLFDTMTEVIKQGGIRRGANMGILNINHPDIEQFIRAKTGNKALRNFNISVLIFPEFWDHYHKNKPWPLINPRTNKTVRVVNPRMLFDKIVYQAWESAEPGIIFYDHVNEYNPFFKHLGPVVTTNPCGEATLYPCESCNLGSVNVWAFAYEDDEGKLQYDWKGLEETTRLATHFLDNVIDVNKFPLPLIEQMTLATRKIGLGIMGVGDLLYEFRVSYASEKGRAIMERVMEFINYHSKRLSIELAKERGAMPYFHKSFYRQGKLPISGIEKKNKKQFDWNTLSQEIKKYGIRNGYTTTIAPTGSISMIAGCSSGMEPVYSLVFEKHVKVGTFYYADPVFEKAMKREDRSTQKLLDDINENQGSVQGIAYLPEHVRHVFVTALDISPEEHIRALAAFQKWTDSSISKTNNFPADATIQDMRESYLLAYKLGCKDVTVFRDTSIKGQVLVTPGRKGEKRKAKIKVETTTTDRNVTYCPYCNIALKEREGCVSCLECGWGLCL